jgi:hypothetical protein
MPQSPPHTLDRHLATSAAFMLYIMRLFSLLNISIVVLVAEVAAAMTLPSSHGGVAPTDTINGISIHEIIPEIERRHRRRKRLSGRPQQQRLEAHDGPAIAQCPVIGRRRWDADGDDESGESLAPSRLARCVRSRTVRPQTSSQMSRQPAPPG